MTTTRRLWIAALAIIGLCSVAALVLRKGRGNVPVARPDIHPATFEAAALDYSAGNGGDTVLVVRLEFPAGRPLEAGLVTVFSHAQAAPLDGWPQPDASCRVRGGRCVLRLHYSGDYSVVASSAGFIPREAETSVKRGEANSLVLTMEKGGARLFGRVVDSQSGYVANAIISLIPARDGYGISSPSKAYSAAADDQGEFEIIVRPGRYRVAVSAAGYAELGEERLAVLYDTEKVFRLSPAGYLRGQVVLAATGESVPNSDLSAVLPRVSRAFRALGDADGKFQLEALPSGVYSLSARKGALVGNVSNVLVLPGKTVEAIVRVSEGLHLNGRIVVEGGKTLQSAGRVTLRRRADPRSGDVTAVAAADGAFFMSGIAAGDYMILGNAEGYPSIWYEVSLGKSIDNYVVRLLAPTSVVGRVTFAERPLGGAVVRLKGLAASGASSFRVQIERDAMADKDGRFSFRGLQAGTYEINASSKEGAGVSPTVNLQHGEEREMDIAIGAGGTIFGRAVFTNGQPAPNVAFSIILTGVGAEVGTAISDVNGDFLVRVPSNETHARFLIKSPDSRVEIRPSSVVVLPGAREKIEVTVSQGEAELTGVVTGPSGDPEADATVLASPVNQTSSISSRIFRTSSDDRGAFRIPEIPGGKYVVWAEKPGLPPTAHLECSTGIPCLTVRFQSSASVSGTVRGIPENGEVVRVFLLTPGPGPDSEPLIRRQVQSGADGAFHFAHLSNGEYLLLAVSGAGWAGRQSLSISTGQTYSGVEMTLRAPITFKARLLNKETGAPLRNVLVNAGSRLFGVRKALTEPDGHVALLLPATGTRTQVFFESAGYNPQAQAVHLHGVDGSETVDLGTKLMTEVRGR